MDVLFVVQWVVQATVVVAFAAALVQLFFGADNFEAIPSVEGAEARPDRISFVDGLLDAEPDMQDSVEEALDWVIAAAPPGVPMAACACIREKDDAYVGTVRVDTKRLHHVVTIHGGSRHGVALGIITECAKWKGAPPGARESTETDECNRAECTMGGYYSLLPPPPD